MKHNSSSAAICTKCSFFLQKRATLRTLDYFYHPLVNTPFTLGIALPQEYGKWRVDGKIDVVNARFNGELLLINIFSQKI